MKKEIVKLKEGNSLIYQDKTPNKGSKRSYLS